MEEDAENAPPALPTHDLSTVVIPLLKGVMYQEGDANYWHALLGLQARVRDYVGVLGLALHIDEAEGFAYLRARPEPDEAAAATPRLVARRPLTFQVSLMLALLRKKLLEFDAAGTDTRLVLSRDELVDMVRVFLPQQTNEARLIDQIDAHLNKVIELGFLRRHKSPVDGQSAMYEVRRILKAFVDAQWLGEFDERLAAYRAQLVGSDSPPAEAADE